MDDFVANVVGSVEVSPSGLWRPPAKRVGSLKLPRGFKSLHLRHVTPDLGLMRVGSAGRETRRLSADD